jgi:hypothetical protein
LAPWAGLGPLLLAWLAGCKAPPGGGPSWWAAPQAEPVRSATIDPTTVKTYDDIIEINQFWQPEPWLYDADGRPVGFRATVYFVSGQTERGAFVPGRILVWLYDVDRAADGTSERKLVYGWQFGPAESMLYRVRKRGMLGYYYGFPLMWGAGIELVGREIEVVFGYERQDGRVITAPARRFKVPRTGGPGGRPLRPPVPPAPEPAPAPEREPPREEPPAPPALGRRNPPPQPATQPAQDVPRRPAAGAER